jgi:hypothetical protein
MRLAAVYPSMATRASPGTPTDELLLGILLAVGGVAVGNSLNNELGGALALLGLLVGVGAYVVSALSAATDPNPPAHHDSASAGIDRSSEGGSRSDSD